MERKKYIFIVLFGLLCFLSYGQNNKSIYQAYISGDMDKWKRTMDSLMTKTPKTNQYQFDLVNYQYGYIAWCIGNHKADEAEKYIKISEKLIQQLEKNEYNLPALYAYKSAFIGFEIGITPCKAPFIGSQSLTYAKQSFSLDTLNSLGCVQLGNIAYYTPKIFGGSKPEAIQHYLAALQIMVKNKENTKGNWNYLNLLATIINSYISLEQYEKAKKYCIKTLSIEPEFDWVKNDLYPQVLKKCD